MTVDLTDDVRIVVAGAGSVGCYVGGILSADGLDVTFLGRDRLRREILSHGLRVSDLTGFDQTIAVADLKFETDPKCLEGAQIILVTVKSGATEEMARLIGKYAPKDAIIISLQNGVTNAGVIQEILGEHTVIPGMVPYNIVQMGEGRFHRGTSGSIMIGTAIPHLDEMLSTPNLAVEGVDDMAGILWGKLLINLNNALNALSGIPLRDQFESHAWRKLLADQMSEALPLLAKAGITPKPAIGLSPKVAPHLMRLPTPVFKVIAGRMLKIDPKARSSMWEDLQGRRKTEIDQLQGSIVALAESLGQKAPLCERIYALIKDAEDKGDGSPAMTPADIRKA